MKISRPKRNLNGSYEGDIFKDSKKNVIKIRMEKAKIVSIKTRKDGIYIYIKHNKHSAKEVSAIQDDVLKIVKENCNNWFKTNLNDDLIEDYLDQNIIYEKEVGQIFRLKCINDISALSSNTSVNILLTLRHIRFYKQKFVLEWEVEEAEIMDHIHPLVDDDTENDDEDDIPVPCLEDIVSLKQQYEKDVHLRMAALEQDIIVRKEKKQALGDLLEKIMDSSSFSEISRFCNDLDKILE